MEADDMQLSSDACVQARLVYAAPALISYGAVIKHTQFGSMSSDDDDDDDDGSGRSKRRH